MVKHLPNLDSRLLINLPPHSLFQSFPTLNKSCQTTVEFLGPGFLSSEEDGLSIGGEDGHDYDGIGSGVGEIVHALFGNTDGGSVETGTGGFSGDTGSFPTTK